MPFLVEFAISSPVRSLSLPRIKICGITDIPAALVASEAGADALGLNFYPPSPRYLEIEQAAAINRALPPFVTSVAVLVNPSADYVREIINCIRVDILQFHGEEEDEFCSSFGRPYIKTIRVTENTDLPNEERRFPKSSGVLLDTHIDNLYGGSGKSFDWKRVQYNGQKPVVLAGGLNPENVKEALSVARPFAVDVCSGVESNGEKDPDKIAAFCDAVRDYHKKA